MDTGQYFLTHYGYLGIFLLLALGIFGPPVADELFLLFLGYLTLLGKIELAPTVAAVVAGSLCGVSLDYLLGRTLGHYLMHRPDSWLHQKYRRIYQLRQLAARSGGWVFICSYFVPGWRHCAPMVAGLARLDFPKFAALTYAAGLFWSLSYIFLGFLLGEKWNGDLIPWHYWFITIAALALGGMAFKFWRKRTAWT
jgi:membrane protein DedA with SNARE-associated domain